MAGFLSRPKSRVIETLHRFLVLVITRTWCAEVSRCTSRIPHTYLYAFQFYRPAAVLSSRA